MRMNGDSMHPIAVRDRASRNDMGFSSAANVGWIQLGTETTFRNPHIEYSEYRVAHAEEKLIAWAIGQRVDLGLAPNAVGEQLRIKALYTERAPCSLQDNREGADQPRYDRVATNRCCTDYLARILHRDVEVIHSVDNVPAPHELLRNGEWVKFHKKQKVRLVTQAFNAKRQAVGYHRELLALFQGHLAGINALQPLSLSRYNCDNHRALVTQAATQAIAELRAWQPPVAADAPPGPSGPPPGPPGPDEPPPGPAKRSGPDQDSEPAAKRALVGVT